jgi:hypothetical protein
MLHQHYDVQHRGKLMAEDKQVSSNVVRNMLMFVVVIFVV